MVFALVMLLAACSKDKQTPSLPDASVSFDLPNGKDTLQVVDMPITENVPLVFNIRAALLNGQASADHRVSFDIDTTKITQFREKYGDAAILPGTSYLFYKPDVVIQAGSSVSDAAELNVGQQKKLRGRRTYVLPVVIRSVDSRIEGPATNRVIYYVFKTAKAQEIPRDAWTIAAFSSQNSSAVGAVNVMDANDGSTYWLSSTAQRMPQFVTINFNEEYTFYGVKYFYPSILPYPSSGGHPTSIMVETSMNGTTWTNKGTFAGNLVNKEQTLEIGETTARYLRFTVLAAVPYSTLPIVFVSGISLVP